jgi:glycerol-3-phosphate dehydrogenase
MEKFTPSELCADIKIYDYKQKVKYDEKSLVIFEKTGKMITAGKECEGVKTADAIDKLSKKYKIYTPIANEVKLILNGKNPKDSLKDLLKN